MGRAAPIDPHAKVQTHACITHTTSQEIHLYYYLEVWRELCTNLLPAQKAVVVKDKRKNTSSSAATRDAHMDPIHVCIRMRPVRAGPHAFSQTSRFRLLSCGGTCAFICLCMCDQIMSESLNHLQHKQTNHEPVIFTRLQVNAHRHTWAHLQVHLCEKQLARLKSVVSM